MANIESFLSFAVLVKEVVFMPVQTPEIIVPALMDGDKVIIPQIWLARNMEYKTDGRQHLNVAAYQVFNPSTLADLRHAYFGKNHDGNWVAPEYRENVLSNCGRGEWTSTFLREGRESIEHPERVFYDDAHGLWLAEGGKVTPVELPPNGWTLEYDKPTGFPSKTSQEREDAEKIFGNDTSYFYYTDSGLRAVLRVFDLGDDGPFYVDADAGPDDRDSDIGVRPCRRSEQDAEHLATPLYVMDQAGYDALTEVSKNDERIRDILLNVRAQK